MKIFTRNLLVMALCFLMHNAFAQASVEGKVVDETGEAIPGVTVLVKGTGTGSVSDINGQFKLDVSSESTLIFSFIGYLTQEVAVGNISSMTVTMEPDIEQLEEVIVVGYGTMKKRDVTGAISKIDSDQMANVRSANAVEGMQGRVAGVDITRSSGRAGAGYKIAVRGNRSLTANNDPLYIVDGVQYSTSDINIDPNDIASMEILKDASSTAIYGSRGANGVIIITTKKGSTGKSTFSFNTYMGVTEGIGSVPLADADYFLKLYNDLAWMKAWQKDPSALPSPTGYKTEMRVNEDENANYDWYDGLLRKGSQQNYNMGFTGGTDKLTYSSSLSYYKEKGLIVNDGFDRVTFRINLESKVSDHISFGTSSLVGFTKQQDRANPLGDARKLSPLAVPFDENGEIIPFPRYNVEVANPFITENTDYHFRETRTTQSFTSFFANFSLFDGALTYRPSVNMETNNKRRGMFDGVYPGVSGLSSASAENKIGFNYTIQNVLNFTKKLGEHSFNITAGSELITRRNEEYRSSGQALGLPNSQWYGLGSAGQQISLTTDNLPLRETTLLSYFGRLHYSLKGKYIFQFTGRYDGASQLAEGHKWNFFPSMSVAWNVIDESFLSGQTTLSDLKLRASYGTSGSQAVPAYSSQGTITNNPLYYQFGIGNTDTNGFRTDRNENPNLGWENTQSTNFGLDFGFFSGRLTGSIETYKTETTELLQDVALSPHSGITRITANVGAKENKGIELALNSTIIDNNELRWTLGATYYANREKITSLASGVQQDLLNGWFVGQPSEVFYDRKFIGIWQESERDEAALYSLSPGDIKLADINGDTIYSGDDRVILGNPLPKWTMGVNTTVAYKGFDLTILVFARWGQMIKDQVMGEFSPDGLNNSMMFDYWTPFNPSNTYPRLDPRRTKSGYAELETLKYTDGSFVKIRDITLGYSLPSNLMSQVGVSKLRLYVTVKNAFVFGDYFDGGNRYDPELNGAIDLPMPRLYAAGLNVTF